MKSRGSLSVFLLVFVTLLVVSGATISKEEVISTLHDTQAFLTDGYAKLGDDTRSERLEEFQREIDGLKTLQEQLKRQEKAVERLVALANAKQVDDLAARITDTLEKEMLLRNSAKCNSSVEKDTVFVDRDDLRKQLGLSTVLGESESRVLEWILKIANEELEDYKNTVLKSVPNRVSRGDNCPTITEVVQDVQVELIKFSQDGVGLVDHAQGAEVVYSMTSPTYEPPPSDYELLGRVWWRRYIPQDWERLLPHGWENWPVNLPSYFYHSLVSPISVHRGVHSFRKRQTSHTHTLCWRSKRKSTERKPHQPKPFWKKRWSLGHAGLWKAVAGK
jgi:hypothetical protein